jgi:hypothetical protein
MKRVLPSLKIQSTQLITQSGNRYRPNRSVMLGSDDADTSKAGSPTTVPADERARLGTYAESTNQFRQKAKGRPADASDEQFACLSLCRPSRFES